MAVVKSQTRMYVAIEWDASALQGDEVEIRATNPMSEAEDKDLSTKSAENNGESFVTYQYGYSGVSDIVVADAEGNEETGQIEV